MRRTARLPAAVLLAACAALVSACTLTVAGQAATLGASLHPAEFVPSASEPDPSLRIPGVRVQNYRDAQHVGPDQRVSYTFSPPIGGRHDQAWAACDGVVYPRPVRSENLVHSLEHGAVWIVYDPARVDEAALDALTVRVEGQPSLVLSPYPGLERPISLQSWGHQLMVGDADDPRIDQFVVALRTNPYTFPEPGATCAEVGQGYFDQDAPPAFAPVPGPAEIDGRTVLGE